MNACFPDKMHWSDGSLTVLDKIMSPSRWRRVQESQDTRLIQEEFGIAYHPGHVRKLLHQMGFSVQRPRRILARANAAEQDRWHRRTFPNLKKTVRRWAKVSRLTPHENVILRAGGAS